MSRQLCVHVCEGTFMGVWVHHRAPGPPGPLPFLTAPWPLWWWWWWPWVSCLWGLGVEAPPLAWGEELLLGLKAGLVPDRPREGCRGLDAARPAGKKGWTGARLLSVCQNSILHCKFTLCECLSVVLIRSLCCFTGKSWVIFSECQVTTSESQHFLYVFHNKMTWAFPWIHRLLMWKNIKCWWVLLTVDRQRVELLEVWRYYFTAAERWV